jgi:GTP diphosphokinase / guanosine-3',5'-bis(diphosphate) 3'-diphosphatase
MHEKRIFLPAINILGFAQKTIQIKSTKHKNVGALHMPMTELEELIKSILVYNPHAKVDLIQRAFLAAEKAHKGQKRESGEDYFIHPLEVAKILVGMKADSATISAALLHDCVEDGRMKMDALEKEFGEEIALIVEGLTKIDRINFETREDYTAENLRRMLFATAKDVRIIIIKIADRLHNMRTLRYFKPEKQKRIALETREIFAPLAHKLGMSNCKGELEDLAMRYLEPEEYATLKRRINEKRDAREKKTKEIIETIKKRLADAGISAEVYGRAKYFFSIYKKMQKEKVDFNEIYDLIAIRIITKDIPTCYAVLGIVHELWKPLPKRFKDYIATPKANGYQSLHTTVAGSHGKILEVQIRTEEMHRLAEDGIAAHWKYKGTERDKKFEKKISWLKQLLDWKRDSEDAKLFIDSLKIDMFEKEIVIFTPKGDPVSLPENSTPVDFAYEVHSDIGDHCSKSMVNNKLVPLDTVLKSGDIVQIITQKNMMPTRQWLKFVQTTKAKEKIRKALNIEPEADAKAREETPEAFEKMIVVDDKKTPLKLSKCCSPKPGDVIAAFYTKDGKITVHKQDCPNIHTLDRKKQINVSWVEKKEKAEKILRIKVNDRVGVLADVLNVIAGHKINIIGLKTRAEKGQGAIDFMKLEILDENEYTKAVQQILKVKDVVDVKEIG